MVKVQIEPGTEEGRSPRWRGIIVHIASGVSFQFENLHEIESVVIPYLEAHGIPFQGDSGSG